MGKATKLAIASLILLPVFAIAEDEDNTNEKQPIWTLQKSICIWIHPEHREEWDLTLAVKEPPFDAQDIETIQYIIDNNIGRVEACVEEQG